MRRLAPAAAAAALTALLLAGCSAGADDASTMEPGVAQPGMPNGETDPMPAEGGEAADSGGELEATTPDDDRSVITTGWMSITVDDPIASAEEAAGIVDQAGGR